MSSITKTMTDNDESKKRRRRDETSTPAAPTRLSRFDPNWTPKLERVAPNPPITTDNKHAFPPVAEHTPTPAFGANPFHFDTKGFRDSATTSTSVKPELSVKKEPKLKVVADHRTASKAMPVYDSDEETRIKANLKKAFKEGDNRAVDELSDQLAAASIAKGISIGSKNSGDGKKKKKLDEFVDSADGSLVTRSLLGTMQSNIPKVADKPSYSVKRFFTDDYKPSYKTTMIPQGTYDTTPRIKGVTCIPSKVGKEDGDDDNEESETGALKEVVAYIKKNFTEEHPSVIYTATADVFEESNEQLKMSDTLSILFDVFRVWAPLQHVNEWDDMINRKVGGIHRYVFHAPYRASATDMNVKMGRFVSINILTSATAAVGKFDKLFGSIATSAKASSANRDSLYKVYASRDHVIEHARGRVHDYELDFKFKQGVKQTTTEYLPYVYAAAQVQQELQKAQSENLPMSLAEFGNRIVGIYNHLWNDTKFHAIKKQLNPMAAPEIPRAPSRLLAAPPLPMTSIATTATASSAYASAQPLPPPVPPTRR